MKKLKRKTQRQQLLEARALLSMFHHESKYMIRDISRVLKGRKS